MRATREPAELIDLVYDTAIDRRLWPNTLNRIADAIDAAVAMIGRHDTGTHVFTAVSPRQDPAALRDYAEHWVSRNPLRQRWRQCPVGAIMRPETIMPREDYLRSEFFNEWMRPQGLEAAIGTTAVVEDGIVTVFAAYRPRRRGEFDRRETALFAALIPHVQRALQLGARLARAETERAGAVAALDRLRDGVLIADAEARLLFANRAAEEILAERTGLCAGQAGLRADSPGESMALRRAIGGCANGSAGGRIRLSRGAERAPLTVLVAPVPAAAEWGDARRPAAILFVTDPERHRRLGGECLRRDFGLTPAEATLALEILKGEGTKPAAARLGISPATARTHLARLLDKTGARRQAEVVRLILETRGAVRDD